MVMGSPTSFLLIGGELIYMQLKNTQMYGGRTISPADNKSDITKNQEKRKKETNNNNNKSKKEETTTTIKK